jgi:retron-type reverse transcriptase
VNLSIRQCKFADSWKRSIVVPIPKKNVVLSLGDLRPISLLPVVSKIVEKVIFRQFTMYLNSREFIDQKQSGFRTGHSCTTALLEITEDVRTAAEVGMMTILLLLDFSKAFDSVRHELLLPKIAGADTSSSVLDWFESYLDGRMQKVRIGKKDSSWKAVTAGVPQGSVGGPLLFSIFINDMPACLKFCRHHMFADDCQIYLSFLPHEMARAVECINTDLRSVEHWAERNGLKLNAQKTQMICMGTSRRVASVKAYVNSNPIQFMGTSLEFQGSAWELFWTRS